MFFQFDCIKPRLREKQVLQGIQVKPKKKKTNQNWPKKFLLFFFCTCANLQTRV